MDNPVKMLERFEKEKGTYVELTSKLVQYGRDNNKELQLGTQRLLKIHSNLRERKLFYLMGYEEAKQELPKEKASNSVTITVPITWATHYGKEYKIHPDYIDEVRKECESVLRGEVVSGE